MSSTLARARIIQLQVLYFAEENKIKFDKTPSLFWDPQKLCDTTLLLKSNKNQRFGSIDLSLPCVKHDNCSEQRHTPLCMLKNGNAHFTNVVLNDVPVRFVEAKVSVCSLRGQG